MHFLRPNYRQMPLSAFLVRLRLLSLLLCLCLVVFNVHQNTATTLISIISRLLNIGYYPIMIDCPLDNQAMSTSQYSLCSRISRVVFFAKPRFSAAEWDPARHPPCRQSSTQWTLSDLLGAVSQNKGLNWD